MIPCLMTLDRCQQRQCVVVLDSAWLQYHHQQLLQHFRILRSLAIFSFCTPSIAWTAYAPYEIPKWLYQSTKAFCQKEVDEVANIAGKCLSCYLRKDLINHGRWDVILTRSWCSNMKGGGRRSYQQYKIRPLTRAFYRASKHKYLLNPAILPKIWGQCSAITSYSIYRCAAFHYFNATCGISQGLEWVSAQLLS